MTTADALVLRTARRTDIEAIDRLLSESYPRLLKADYPPSVLVTVIPVIARARPRLVTSGTYFVAEREGRIVGAGGWSPVPRDPTDPRTRRAASIRHVVTDWREVRRGIGRALLTHVIEDAARAGAHRLTCRATLTAVPFYRALGFTAERVEAVEMLQGIPFEAMVMWRTL
ncbi:GNAT family N-acetyltransferase [Roseivivax isoporae]|uniref:Acetyltransferase n=1 Tax=Roseivivax isoporae LMG 25204 TaxID=1449351 RepID=X7FAT0_9RHOB|nr:GNAT family N-acetyltransferase [Roseivivax isoporae]ETX29216.1 acetyltransferase [Roseivivax isoporae LMG 25204]